MNRFLVPALLAAGGAAIGVVIGEAHHRDDIKEARSDLVSLEECKQGLEITERRIDGFLYCAGLRLYEPVGIIQEDEKVAIDWEKTERTIREPIDSSSARIDGDIVLGLGGMGVGTGVAAIVLLNGLIRERKIEEEVQATVPVI